MFGVLSRGLLAALGVVMATAASGATIGPLGLHHEAVDEQSYPWSAIGKLFNEAGGQCSGVAIARDKILTAAHCLFSVRTRRFTAAASMHFKIGYRAGRYSVEARIVRYQIGAGFDPLRYQETTDADWAVLTLAENLPADIEPLRLSHDAEPSGTKAVLAGYPQDRAYAMTADRDCELLEREKVNAGRLLLHTCRGIKGYSGAPILVGGGGEIRVAGIQIAIRHGAGAPTMLAVPAQAIWHATREDWISDSLVVASAACRADVGGPGDIFVSDVQVRLDPNRLDLSAQTAETLDGARPNVVAQLASRSLVAVQ